MNEIYNSFNNVQFGDEVIIDIFTTGLGAYCGSFVCGKEYADRVVFAINTCGNLLIDGRQDNYERYGATIRI